MTGVPAAMSSHNLTIKLRSQAVEMIVPGRSTVLAQGCISLCLFYEKNNKPFKLENDIHKSREGASLEKAGKTQKSVAGLIGESLSLYEASR